MRRALAIAALFFSPGLATAFDFEISSHTIGQADEIRRFADNQVVLMSRRRITQMLDLRLYNFLAPPDPDSGKIVPRLQAVSSMRFDTDFGDFRDTEDADGVNVVPELENNQFDLLLLYVEGTDFVGGWLDFRIGRQMVTDPLDWFAFDGGYFFLRPPVGVGVEGFGGLEVRGDDPISSSVMELDGTSLSADPFSDQLTVFAPMFGGAIVTHGLQHVQARISYRRTQSRATIETGAGPGDQDVEQLFGVDEEKVAASVRGAISETFYPWGGMRYNILVGRIDQAEAGVRLQLHPRHGLTPSYVRVVPTFAGDSIFNVFSTEAYQDFAFKYDVESSARRLRGYVKYLARRFSNESFDPAVDASSLYHGAGAGALYLLSHGLVRVDGRFDVGQAGHTAGGDVAGEWRILRDELTAEGRVTAVHYAGDDNFRASDFQRDMWSFGVQGGARYTLADGVALHVLLEENTNQLYDSYFRVLAMLDLAYRP